MDPRALGQMAGLNDFVKQATLWQPLYERPTLEALPHGKPDYFCMTAAQSVTRLSTCFTSEPTFDLIMHP